LGHIWVVARVCRIDRSRCVEAEALVDTGATLSVVPRRLAEELGLEVRRRDRAETGAGVIEVDRAPAIIGLEGRETISEVWVSDIVDKILIGAVTLELLGLKLDPRTGKLEPAPLLLYQYCA